MLALAITAAIVPALLLLWYFHSRDVYPEPPRVVWATFFLGVLSIPFVLLVAVPTGRLLVGIASPYWFGFTEAFACAAIPEEFFKFLVLYGYASRHKEFNEPMDGVIYGVAASLGFATLENILYVGSGGMGVALMRALTAVPGHAFTGAVMGYYVGRARFAGSERVGLYGLALLVPMLLHGTYDFPLLIVSRFKKTMPAAEVPNTAALLGLLTAATLGYEYRLAMRLVRRLRAEQDAGRDAALPVAPGSAPGSALMPVSAVAPVSALGSALMPGSAVAPGSGSLLGWIGVVSGGVLITGGGLLVTMLIVALVTDTDHRDIKALLLGGTVLAGPPLLLGLGLYRGGIKRLNRAGSKVPAGVSAPATA